jgi:AmmeMemoRadiSam system protein B
MGEVRAAAVAGRFYPEDAAALRTDVARFIGDARSARPHLGVVAPHAGYVYSGGVAGKVFGDTAVPRRVIVLAPNHTGRGARLAVWARGSFALPGERIAVDEELCERLLTAARGRLPLAADHEAHRYEHALEVELPFLRARQAELRIAPIIVGGVDGETCMALGALLAEVVAQLGEEVLVVASSDMSHYLPDATARAVDERAIAPMLAVDPAALYRVVTDEDISMCGILPVTTMLSYARQRGATRGRLVAYATSAEAFGDRERVVGYAGVVVD